MGRAFVNETDAEFQDDEIPEIKIPLPNGAHNYMTPAGADRLRRELKELNLTDRPRLSAELEGLMRGDSNTERDARATARRRLAEVDRRIEYLSRMNALLEVVNVPAGVRDRVSFGTTVTTQSAAIEKLYTIVGVDESDPEHGRISWVSPLARALVGSRLGDRVTARLPSGDVEIRITAISGA